MKDISGYEGLYAATEDGKIWSYPKKGMGHNHNGKWLKPSISHNGYYRVILQKNSTNPKIFFVHRLVAYVYKSKPLDKTEINHIDGNKLNNHVSNLEWVTSSENQKHAFRIGLQKGKKGKDNPASKKVQNLDTSQIFDTLKEAAQFIGLSLHAISKCCSGANKTAGGYRWSYYE